MGDEKDFSSMKRAVLTSVIIHHHPSRIQNHKVSSRAKLKPMIQVWEFWSSSQLDAIRLTEFVLGMNFSVDFNFAGFFNELRFLECASDYVGFHISPCSFQCSDNFANCCRPVVPQPCDNPVCLYAILATLFSPTSSHGCVF